MDGLNDDDPYEGESASNFHPEIWSDHLFDALRFSLIHSMFENSKNPMRLQVSKPIGRVKLLRRRIYLWIWNRYTEYGYSEAFLLDYGDGPFPNMETDTHTWIDNPDYVPPKSDEVVTIYTKGRNHGTDNKNTDGSAGSVRQDGVPEL